MRQKNSEFISDIFGWAIAAAAGYIVGFMLIISIAWAFISLLGWMVFG